MSSNYDELDLHLLHSLLCYIRNALDYGKPGQLNGGFFIIIAIDIAKTVMKMLPLLCIDSDQLNFMQPSVATRCVFHRNETPQKMNLTALETSPFCILTLWI